MSFSPVGDRKRTNGRLDMTRGIIDAAGSSTDVPPHVNPYADDMETPIYTVETTERRKSSMWAPMGTDQSHVASGSDLMTRAMSREVPHSADQVKIEDEPTGLEMHMAMETGAANTTIARSVRTGAVTRTASADGSATVGGGGRAGVLVPRMSMLPSPDHVSTQKRQHLHTVATGRVDRR